MFKPILRRMLPKLIRPHRILSGPIKGMSIVTSWHDYPAAIMGYTESDLLNWITLNVHAGETWIDIGAHYGYTSLAFCEYVGLRGRVFSFEPKMSTAGYLMRTKEINQLRQLSVLPFALGADGNVSLSELPVSRGMLDSTLEDSSWKDSFLLTSLDWIWPQISSIDIRLDGIKIDVQGMELETIKGMVNVLERFQPKLIIEFHSGVDRLELVGIISNLGYSRNPVLIGSDIYTDPANLLDNTTYVFNRG